MVAVITGANSGVGLAIAKRLLAHSKSVVLACRNAGRAASAQQQLLSQFPNATIHVVQLDTSSTKSVLNAAYEINKLGPVDLLFCNAGAMAIAGLSLKAIAYGLLTRPIEFFESSDALVQQRGLLSSDGMGLTFQTNVFGHYLLIHKLEFAGGARVIWTGSAASRLAFSYTDFMHVHGPRPYESSKFVIDQIAIPLDNRLSRKNVRCLVAEPGN
ncbi:3-keto-steroid reductase, partial [Coemansia sp. RSA 1086]